MIHQQNEVTDENSTITDLIANDVRFPTSLHGDGSDAMVSSFSFSLTLSLSLSLSLSVSHLLFVHLCKHTDPDYSCVYVRILLDGFDLNINNGDNNSNVIIGHGHTFTIGRGTEVG